jgi:hypothetical protein
VNIKVSSKKAGFEKKPGGVPIPQRQYMLDILSHLSYIVVWIYPTLNEVSCFDGFHRLDVVAGLMDIRIVMIVFRQTHPGDLACRINGNEKTEVFMSGLPWTLFQARKESLLTNINGQE